MEDAIIPQIIMDERERGEIRRAFTNLKCDLQIHTLECGDFIISSRIGIERKRGDDLVSSIFDNRLFLQLQNLALRFECPILILENPKKLFSRSFIKESSIYGALMYVANKMQISIITCENESETAETIYKLAIKEQKAGFIPKIESKSELEKQVKITREEQLHFLQGLIDTGYTKAEKILDVFGNPYFVIYALLQSTVQYTPAGTPKQVSGMFANLSGFGPKYVDRNIKLLNSNYKINLKEKTQSHP